MGLCILARLPETQLVGVEIDPDLCRLARKNAVTNGFAERARFVAGDIAGPFSALELEPNSFDHVVANPPFTKATGCHPCDVARARAHQTDAAGLENWVRCACALAVANGLVTFVHRAEALDDLLSAMRGRLGALKVQPVTPRAGETAHRVLVQGRRDAHAFGAVAADYSAKCDRRAKRRSRSGFAPWRGACFCLNGWLISRDSADCDSASGKIRVGKSPCPKQTKFPSTFSKSGIEPATILGRSGLRDIAAL